MHWKSVSDFFAMGGYALYVWGAYVMTAACLALEVAALRRRARRARALISTETVAATPHTS